MDDKIREFKGSEDMKQAKAEEQKKKEHKKEKKPIQLADHFTYGRLLRFTLPSIGMMIFASIYGVVDGFLFRISQGKHRLRRLT